MVAGNHDGQHSREVTTAVGTEASQGLPFSPLVGRAPSG